jgi:hypothetical protein
MASLDTVRNRLISAGVIDVDTLPLSAAAALDSLSDEEMKALAAAQSALAGQQERGGISITGGYIF